MEPVCLVPISSLNVEFKQPFSFEGLKEKFTLCMKDRSLLPYVYLSNVGNFRFDHSVYLYEILSDF